MKQVDAIRLAIANKLYMETKDVTWLDRDDVRKFAKDSGLETDLTPYLMYYQGDELVAVYINKHMRKLSDHDKTIIESRMMVNKIIEIV
jgi:hypothetical protein